MEKKIRNQRFVIAVLAILLLLNTFTLFQIKEDLNQFNNNALNGIQDVRSSVNTILSEIRNIQSENEAEASLITSFDYQYGELDTSKMTVPVSVKIVPKAVSGDTAVTLEFGGRTVEMKKSDSSTEFAAEFEVGIFEHKDNGDVRLVITNGGISETEELDWSLGSLPSEFLPSVGATFIFSDITLVSDGIRVDGRVSGHIEKEDMDRFKSIKLIYKVNGEAVATEEIDDLDLYSVTKVLPGYGEGDTFELYLEAEDEFGFVHEIMLKKVMFAGKDDAPEETEPDYIGGVIKDKKGNVLCS